MSAEWAYHKWQILQLVNNYIFAIWIWKQAVEQLISMTHYFRYQLCVCVRVHKCVPLQWFRRFLDDTQCFFLLFVFPHLTRSTCRVIHMWLNNVCSMKRNRDKILLQLIYRATVIRANALLQHSRMHLELLCSAVVSLGAAVILTNFYDIRSPKWSGFRKDIFGLPRKSHSCRTHSQRRTLPVPIFLYLTSTYVRTASIRAASLFSYSCISPMSPFKFDFPHAFKHVPVAWQTRQPNYLSQM